MRILRSDGSDAVHDALRPRHHYQRLVRRCARQSGSVDQERGEIVTVGGVAYAHAVQVQQVNPRHEPDR